MYDYNTTFPTNNNMSNENEITYLRRQLRLQEVEYKKNKAVLEQKIEILELQNQELKEREEGLKKMNNSIMNALNDVNKENDHNQNRNVRELEYTNNLLTKELSEAKSKLQESIKNLEKDNTELKGKLNDMENKYNHMVLNYEKKEFNNEQKIMSLEDDKKKLEIILKTYEDEKKQHKNKENVEYELQRRITEFKFYIEKQNEDHQRKIDKIHADYNVTIANFKKIFDAEKALLQTQISKLEDANKQERTTIEGLKEAHNSEISGIKGLKDQAFNKIDYLEKQIHFLNNLLKTYEEKIENRSKEIDYHERESLKFKEKISELEDQIKQLENIEKKLREDLLNKDQEIEEVKIDSKKKINIEKRRLEQVQELNKKSKNDTTKTNALILQECLKKDELIKKLKNQLAVKSRETIRISKNADMTPIKNTSMINNSLNVLKRDKESIHSNMQDENSHTSMRLGLKIETPDMDITNDNILFGLNSPRNFHSSSTYRNATDKKDIEFCSIQAYKKTNNKNDKSLVVINSETNDGNIQKTEEDQFYSKFKNQNENTEGINNSQMRSTATIADGKKSLTITTQNEKQPFYGLLTESLKYISYLECCLCKGDFGLSDFLEHLFSCLKNNQTKVMNLNFSNCENFINSTEYHQNNQIDLSGIRSKSIILGSAFNSTNKSSNEERIKDLEERLKVATNHNERLKIEKEKMQVELDRIILELKQIKLEWAISEEKKEECELSLKNEIKFLINKLVQAKGPNLNISGIDGSLYKIHNKAGAENSGSFVNNSGFLNYYGINHTSMNYSSFANQIYDQNMMIINNNLGDISKDNQSNKNHYNLLDDNTKRHNLDNLKESSSKDKLKSKLNQDHQNLGDSPNKVNEFFTNNNNSILHNIKNSTSYPKIL